MKKISFLWLDLSLGQTPVWDPPEHGDQYTLMRLKTKQKEILERMNHHDELVRKAEDIGDYITAVFHAKLSTRIFEQGIVDCARLFPTKSTVYLRRLMADWDIRCHLVVSLCLQGASSSVNASAFKLLTLAREWTNPQNGLHYEKQTVDRLLIAQQLAQYFRFRGKQCAALDYLDKAEKVFTLDSTVSKDLRALTHVLRGVLHGELNQLKPSANAFLTALEMLSDESPSANGALQSAEQIQIVALHNSAVIFKRMQDFRSEQCIRRAYDLIKNWSPENPLAHCIKKTHHILLQNLNPSPEKAVATVIVPHRPTTSKVGKSTNRRKIKSSPIKSDYRQVYVPSPMNSQRPSSTNDHPVRSIYRQKQLITVPKTSWRQETTIQKSNYKNPNFS